MFVCFLCHFWYEKRVKFSFRDKGREKTFEQGLCLLKMYPQASEAYLKTLCINRNLKRKLDNSAML